MNRMVEKLSKSNVKNSNPTYPPSSTRVNHFHCTTWCINTADDQLCFSQLRSPPPTRGRDEILLILMEVLGVPWRRFGSGRFPFACSSLYCCRLLSFALSFGAIEDLNCTANDIIIGPQEDVRSRQKGVAQRGVSSRV